MRLIAVFVTIFAVSVASAAAWTSVDVPAGLVPAGSAVEEPPGSGSWTVKGAGNDIWDAKDEFHFLSRDEPFEGDFAVSARVVSLELGEYSPWAKAGIMARLPAAPGGALDGAEPFAMALVTIDSGALLQVRDEPGSDVTLPEAGLRSGAAIGPADTYLKLVRVVDTVFAYAGVKPDVLVPPIWVSLGTYDFEYLEGEPLAVGLAVTARNLELPQKQLATAWFDSIKLNDTSVSNAGPTDFVCARDATQVILTWKNNAIYTELALYRENLENGVFNRIAAGINPSADTHTDTPGVGLFRYWIMAIHNALETAAQQCVAGAWLSDDVADSGLVGAVSGKPDELTIIGSGHDIGGASDDFRFVWIEADAGAPALIEARLTSFPYRGESLAKAGIMFRTFMTHGSPFVMGLVRPDSDDTYDRALYWRAKSDQRVVQDLLFWNPDDNVALPTWIRGTYAGGKVAMAFAADAGGEPGPWTELEPKDLELHGSATLLCGLAVTSRTNWGRATATFDKIRVITGGALFKRGDTNADTRLNVSDPILLLRYLYLKSRTPPCLDAADTNDDGAIDGSDVTYMLYYLFLSGPALPPPLGVCGADTTLDTIPCASYPPCD